MSVSAVDSAFDTYTAAFGTLDLATIVPLYDSELAIVTSQGVNAMNGVEAIRSYLADVTERLKAQGYRRTDLRDRQTRMLSESLAQISGLAVRFDSSDHEIARFGLIYTFRCDNGNWKLSAMVIHDAA